MRARLVAIQVAREAQRDVCRHAGVEVREGRVENGSFEIATPTVRKEA